MRVIFIAAAATVILAVTAQAQDGGGWGDSSAAIFNAPKGYGSESEFSGAPKGSTRDANGNRTIVNGRYTDNCYYNVDGVTPGVGSRSKVNGTPGFPQNPCANGTGTPAIQNQAIGNNVTVVTTGHWNTVVVDTTQTNNGNQSATLNGGLNLD